MTNGVEKRIIIKLTHEGAQKSNRKLSEPRGIPESKRRKKNCKAQKRKQTNRISKSSKAKVKKKVKRNFEKALDKQKRV